VCLKIKIFLLALCIGLPLCAQTFVYSYTDPCTQELKFINADMNSPIVIAYYGQVKTFSYTELQDGTFDAWINDTYIKYKSTSPCQGIVTTTTTTTSTNTTLNIISSVMNLGAISNVGSISSVGVNVGSSTSSGTNVGTTNKENNGSSSSNRPGSTSSNSSNPDSKAPEGGEPTQGTGSSGDNPSSPGSDGGSSSGSPLFGWEATSTSTITPVIGDNAFTLVEAGKAFTVGQFVTVADTTLLNDNYFVGVVKTFNPTTGAITVTSKTVVGGTTASNWAITASAASKGERFVSPVQTFVALGNISGTVNIDLRVALKYSMTLTGNTTLTFTMPEIFSSNTETWCSLLITKGGSYSLAVPAGSQWTDGAAPNPASGTKNEYLATKQGNDNWIWSLARKGIA